MEDLIVEKVDFYSPGIHFDAETGLCSIEGESALEETVDFYAELTEWLVNYMKTGKVGLKINIKLSYLNTSSIRAYLDMFFELKSFISDGKEIEINWFYQEPDLNEIKTEGEDLANILGIPLNLVPYTID